MSPAMTGGVLPLEVWRVIFDYLDPRELCACSCVCRSWMHLIDSLDTRTWRRHFLDRFPWVMSPDWQFNQRSRRTSSWPDRGDFRRMSNFSKAEESEEEGEPESHSVESSFWKKLYLRELNFSRSWRLDSPKREQAACVGVLRRRGRALADNVRASPNPSDLRSLRMAVYQAKAYATVELEPGLHEDSSRLDLNRPVHLSGIGELGSVVVSVAIVNYAPSIRLSNLVLRAPWFTECMLQVHEGSLHAENCRFELGETSFEFADGICLRHCHFERCLLNVGRTGPMLIEHCVFHHPDGDCVNINGPSSLPRTPVCQFLYRRCRQRLPELPPVKTLPEKPRGKQNDDARADQSLRAYSDAERAQSLPVMRRGGRLLEKNRSTASASHILDHSDETAALDGAANKEDAEDDEEDFFDEATGLDWRKAVKEEPSSEEASVERRELFAHRLIARFRRKCCRDARRKALLFPEVRRHVFEMGNSAHVHIYRCEFYQSHTGVTIVQGGEVAITHCNLSYLQCAVRGLGSTKLILFANEVRGCSQSAFILRNGATGVVAANRINEVMEAAMEVRRRSNPVIVHNKIRYSRRCGIVCLTQSNPLIRHNEISYQGETGIHILYKADPIVRANLITHSKACGIAVSGDGRGVISDNLVAYHDTCGVNIYKLGDPVLRENLIMKCAGVGVLIRDEGSGMISNNVIHGNSKAGVCLNAPFMCQIHSNRISNNNGDGVVVVTDVQSELDLGRTDENGENANHAGSGHRRRYYLFDPTDDDEDQPWISWDQRLTLINRNSIVHNSGCGLQTLDNVPLDLHANSVHGNRSHGISLRIPGLLTSQRTMAIVRGNLVTENQGCGIYGTLTSLSGGTVEVHGNGVYDNDGAGLLLRSIPCRVEENDLVGNAESAVTLEGEFHVRFIFNRLLAAAGDSLIRLSSLLRGKFVHNLFYSPVPDSVNFLLRNGMDETEMLLKCFDNRQLSSPQGRGADAESLSQRVSWSPNTSLEPKPRPMECYEREMRDFEDVEVRGAGGKTRRRRGTMNTVGGCGPNSLMCTMV